MSIFTEGTFNDPVTQDDLEPTTGARVSATVSEAWNSLLGPSAYRRMELDEAQKWGGMAFQEYSPDQAKEWIAGQGLEGHLTPEDRPYNQLELSILARRKRAELQRQYVLDRAGGGVARGVENLTLSLATSLADPFTVATAFVPVVNEATYGRLLAQAGRSALARAGVRAGVGAAEGTVGQALVEPIVYGAHQAEQADYTLYDSLANIAFGGVFGGGLHSVGGAVIDYRTGRREATVARAADTLRARLESIDTAARAADKPAAGMTADTGLRSADVPDPYYDRARSLVTELRKSAEVDPQSPASVSSYIGRKVQSLAQFIRETGGISDVGGELAARDVTTKRAPGLIRKDGMGAASVDAVRQRVFDAGFFPGRQSYNEISDSELFDAIAGDLFQQKRYPIDVEERLLGARDREDFIGQLEQWGIRPGMSPEDVAVRLREMDTVTRASDAPASTAEADAEYQRLASTRADAADPQTRENALRAVVAQDLAGEPVNVEPLFELDPATRTRPIGETLDQLRRPAAEPQPEPVPIVDATERTAIEQQVADLTESLRDLEAQLKLDEADLPADLRADLEAVKEAEAEASDLAETARMLAACAMRKSA